MLSERNLLFHVLPFMRRLVLALVCMFMVALFNALLPVIIQPLMDEMLNVNSAGLTQKARIVHDFIQQGLNIGPEQLKLVLPLLLFFSFLGYAVFNFFALYLMKTLGLKVVKKIRDDLYSCLVNQSIDFLSKAKTGDLVSRISNDIDKINFAVSETLSVYVREPLTMLVLLVVIFYQDYQMSLYCLIIVPVAAGLLTAFGQKVKKRGIQSQEAIGELSNFLTETVVGNKIVKAYNMEQYEIDKFSTLNTKYYKINSRIALLYASVAPIMHVIGGLLAAFIVSLGMYRISAGKLTPGQFLSFLTALFLMYNPMKRLSQAHNDYQLGNAGYMRVRQIMGAKNPIQERPSAIDLQDVKGQVEFRNVSFAYDHQIPVIKGVNFSIKPAEMVALVGASGAGKTTLMNLLIRFYEIDDGQILIDGHDIRDFSIKSLRDAIGLVTQDIFLFNDTIENNIVYGNRKYRPEEIREAARIARATDFIDALPQKYDAVVGERGLLLSTGQRQRISIARAVLKKPAILIFDEATSSLDTESESLIKEAMADVIRGRTTFVIAHRLSTIIEADTILVIEKGELKERGNHRELLKKKGVYYSLYNLQFPNMDIVMEK